jgi:ketosteroid isomerase-like protein
MIRTTVTAIALACAATAAAFAQNAQTAIDGAMQADREFAAYAREHGLAAAFSHYAAEDARILRPGSDDIVGPEAIFGGYPDGGDMVLHWWPRGGYGSQDGSFAVTYGSWEFYPDGNMDADPAGTGDYVSAWRLTDDGWRFVLDTGNSDPAPQPAETE